MARDRGRPAFQPTDKQRMAVEQMVFAGEQQQVIARALGITLPTLRKHFAEELETGHAQRRLEVIGLLFDAGRGGNVAALKALEVLGRAAEPAAKPKAAEVPGKKETAARAAQRVGKKFQPASAPRLVVDNR